MQRSNSYIIIFSLILTVVIGGLLSGASVFLGPAQKIQVELDTKSQILGAVMPIVKGEDDVLGIYDKKIESLVVDIKGNVVEKNHKGAPAVAEDINVAKNYKLAPEDRLYPVFKFKNESGAIESYIFPVYGNGLWDKIWGFIALDNQFQTVKGVAFDHQGETPGLGARISDKEIQSRYVGKKVYTQSGELISVSMVKGEKGLPLGDHQVDGMSGATITGNGVNKMLLDYLGAYQAYISNTKASTASLN